jgi:hypothetical protein
VFIFALSFNGQLSGAFLKTRRREIVDPDVAWSQGRLVNIGAARTFVIIALSLATASCGDAEHTDFLVDKATVMHDAGGNVALDVLLNDRSVRDFARYSSYHYGHVIELRFSNAVLNRAHLDSPFYNGHFQISLLDPPVDQRGATELARQLSSGGATIEVRVVDAAR